MIDDMLSWLEDLEGVLQNAAFHPEGDALFHSLQVFEHALRDRAEPPLLAAALFHDIGKATSGRDHDQVGADLAIGLPARTRWCIGHHLDLLRQPRQTRAWLMGDPRLADLRHLRRWDLAGREPTAWVREPEEAVAIVAEALGVEHGW